MKESKMSKAVTPSLTRKLFNMALDIGDDVINLTLGDPDILPPREVREAGCEAIMSGKTRYSANAGLLELRKIYGSFFLEQYGIEINPLENIIVTVGGMEALFLSLSSMIDYNDEVIVLSPYYVNYYQMIHMCGGKAVVINRMGKSSDSLIREINNNITERTIAIIVNSPCNPVGDIVCKEVIDGISTIAYEKNLFIISDEVYSSLIFDGKKHDSIISRRGMLERTIVIDSCSKRFAMTGWRVGFAVGHKDIISRLIKMQENVAACAPLPSQYAAIKAYSGDVDYKYIQKEYERRRNIVYDALTKIRNINPIKPEATFYCFVDISRTGLKCEDFAYRLLKQKHVAVVPGKAYGEEYDDYVRIAFTLKEELLNEAMKRIKDFCEEFI